MVHVLVDVLTSTFRAARPANEKKNGQCNHAQDERGYNNPHKGVVHNALFD
jgi:hypothetical protein